MSVAAISAAMELARDRKLLLSEALSIRTRARGAAADAKGPSSGLHWDEMQGVARLEEVMGRMQGKRAVLERLLLAP